jgi:hypothetical protein
LEIITSIYVARNFVRLLRMTLITRIEYMLLIERKTKAFSDSRASDLKTQLYIG